MNYCEYFANELKKIFPSFEVYSNIDPTREFVGNPILEFSEVSSETIRFITGCKRKEISLSMAARAADQTKAFKIGQRVRSIVDSLIEDLVGKTIDGWIESDEGVVPDARGITLGESFYWYMDFKILEKKE